ncbi:hypothetical protein QOZ80_7BG0609370 [Eleusine coracana subsp. coracana]|nr:hypothetical protein QOZ80_7BG0609370 [Eleusine coracana subsp. coracana]
MARIALVALAVILALASGAAAQAPAPAPGPSSAAPDCGAAVSSLIVCAAYVQPGSAQSTPPKPCCDGVKAAMTSPAAVQCLCDALGKDYGVPLNMTRAAGLPIACGGDPAAFSKCNIKLPGGAPTPAGAPAPTSGSTPAASSPGGWKSAATRSPITAVAVVAAVAAPLLSYYCL